MLCASFFMRRSQKINGEMMLQMLLAFFSINKHKTNELASNVTANDT